MSGGDGAGGTWEFKDGQLILKFAKWHGNIVCKPVDENTYAEVGGATYYRIMKPQ